jgi:hypothetical protein
MGYESQIAGLMDEVPGQGAKNAVIRLLKRRSIPEVNERRRATVAALAAAGHALRFVNGGGTGSFESTRADASVTELAAGSGLYVPTLFDHYRAFRGRPAAGFAVAVTRAPAPGIVTCAGGGYPASGPGGADRLPRPWLPAGCTLIATEGAGEVQTPVRVPAGVRSAPGDPLLFRHAKAGELCERFNELLLIEGGRWSTRSPPTAATASVSSERGRRGCGRTGRGMSNVRARRCVTPDSGAQLAQVLADAARDGKPVRMVGAGHSFSPLVASDGVIVSLDKLQGVIDVDADTRVARVHAGTRLYALGAALAQRGLAMENLGDINVQSIAGATSTGTHGTGIASATSPRRSRAEVRHRRRPRGRRVARPRTRAVRRRPHRPRQPGRAHRGQPAPRAGVPAAAGARQDGSGGLPRAGRRARRGQPLVRVLLAAAHRVGADEEVEHHRRAGRRDRASAAGSATCCWRTRRSGCCATSARRCRRGARR